MLISILPSDQMSRIGEVDRTEMVEADYIPTLTDDGMGLILEKTFFDPPRVVPHWDEVGVNRRVQFWRPMVDAGGLFIAAEKDGRMLGFAILALAKDSRHAEMAALFIDSRHRFRGIGRLLVEEVEKQARAKGMQALFVQSNSTIGSVDFYRKMGYRLMCLADHSLLRFPETETSIILVKNLGI